MENLTLILNKDRIIYHLINLPQIVFEVTDSCNLKCKYCGYGEFYGDHDARDGSVLAVNKVFVLFEYLKKLWLSGHNQSFIQQVYIGFYGGEPLLNIDFIRQVVAYVEKLNIPNKSFAFSMTTNALQLEKNIEYLVAKNFSLLISIDGNEYHHSYRVDQAGNNSHYRVFRNIKLLQERYPDFFASNVNFNAVLHNRNNVSDVFNFIKNEFGKNPRIAELNSTGIREDKRAEFMSTYRNKYENLHQSEHYEDIDREMFIESPDTKELGIFLHQYSGNTFRTYNDLLDNKSDKINIPTGTCLPFSKKMFVTVQGKILPCERIGHQYSLGKVTETDVILDLEEIVSKYNTWFNKLDSQCSRCQNTKACMQCIFNLEGLDEKPICKGFMNKEVFQRYVCSQLGYLGKNPYLYKKIMEEVIVR